MKNVKLGYGHNNVEKNVSEKNLDDDVPIKENVRLDVLKNQDKKKMLG